MAGSRRSLPQQRECDSADAVSLQVIFEQLAKSTRGDKIARPALSDHRRRHHVGGRSALPCVVSRLQGYSLLILVQT